MSKYFDASELKRLFNQGKSYTEIASALSLTKGVVAGRCRKFGLVRNPDRTGPRKIIISAEEQAERVQDHRDLDMLSDIKEGHTVRDTAKHWGVTPSHVNRLLKEARVA